MAEADHGHVATIAVAVGFPDSSYFARQFEKIHWKTPRDYRTQNA